MTQNRSPPSWRSSMRQEATTGRRRIGSLSPQTMPRKSTPISKPLPSARRLFSMAEKLPDEVRRQLTLEATLKLGELHLTISELEAAADDFRQAAEIAEEAGLREVQIDALCAAALAEFTSNGPKEHAR